MHIENDEKEKTINMKVVNDMTALKPLIERCY